MNNKRSFSTLRIILIILAIIGGVILGFPCVVGIVSQVSSTQERVIVTAGIVLSVMIVIVGAISGTLSVRLFRRFNKVWKQVACIVLLIIFLCF